jgi:DNA-binding transcriptional LysR family regulator
MKPTYAKMQSKLGLADLELMLAVIRGRTLNGAAERLRLDSSTVFRSIKRMEQDLGERLFERSKEGYMPTELALKLAVHAERIESQLQEARDTAYASSGEPSGVLRITTTDTILHGLLLPLLDEFACAYPRIDLELITSNTLADLSRRDADVAIRATRKPPEHLVGTNLGTMSAAVCAGKSYLERMPKEFKLEDADWITLDESLVEHPSLRWRRTHYPKVLVRYRCNSVLSVTGCIVHGLGVGVVPMFLAQNNPSLEIVDGPLDELDTNLWILAHPDIRHLHRVKLLFDFLKSHLVI